MNSRLRIAICGTRGIPACYGGFETFAEEISKRLVARGHSVRVYGRKHLIDYSEELYNGVEIKLLPAPKFKYFETLGHTFFSFLHLLKNKVDIILVCNGANSPLIWIPRFIGRMPVIVNVDGIERKRGKWNRFGKIWYRLGELCSVYLSNRFISDAEVIRQYYQDTFNKTSLVIPYGCRDVSKDFLSKKIEGTNDFPRDRSLFLELGVDPGNYILYVSRLEPENNAHIVIKAYNELRANSKITMPLLIVGDAPYAKSYINMLKDIAGEGIIFAGYRFGKSYEELQKSAYLYVQATEVGGTHPALVEAMGFANCIVVNSTPENLEVVGNCAIPYEFNNISSLAHNLSVLIEDKSKVLDYRRNARARVEKYYSWDVITKDYEQLFYELTVNQADSYGELSKKQVNE